MRSSLPDGCCCNMLYYVDIQHKRWEKISGTLNWWFLVTFVSKFCFNFYLEFILNSTKNRNQLFLSFFNFSDVLRKLWIILTLFYADILSFQFLISFLKVYSNCTMRCFLSFSTCSCWIWNYEMALIRYKLSLFFVS